VSVAQWFEIGDRETRRAKLRVSNAISVPHIYKEHPIYPLDDARADPSDGALDSLVARRAHHQSAARINRRQQRVAVLQAMLEVFASLKSPRDYPSQLAFLERYQHSCVSPPVCLSSSACARHQTTDLGFSDFYAELPWGYGRPDVQRHGCSAVGEMVGAWDTGSHSSEKRPVPRLLKLGSEEALE
jgi:hypothetical protein